MLRIAPGDSDLRELVGSSLDSHVSAGVRYELVRVLGAGGMAVAFMAFRRAPDGQSPCVLKLLRPEIVRDIGTTATLMVQKEAVALGRLNEKVPATPFVVRLIDTGQERASFGGGTVDLPWLAIEYVHGGPEGTTLEERVEHSMQHTGAAFDAVRAAHAIECLASGLTAIHEVDVIHRDVTPANVLCCGFGDEEILKIADFGIARPAGLAGTFGGVVVGTPGYAPPEQFLLDASRIGQWSDLFAVGAVIFYLLTGERYFPIAHAGEAVQMAQKPHRRSVLETRGLCAELRERPAACRSIDEALSRATAVDPQRRPQSPGALAAMLVPHVKPASVRSHVAPSRVRTVIGEAQTLLSGWTWTMRHKPGNDAVIRRVAWDGDGHCLAATSKGLAFWNGTTWLPARHRVLPRPENTHFVRRMAAGVWLVGGTGGFMAVYTPEGVVEVIHGPDSLVTYEQASGDINELAVFCGTRQGEPPTLFGMSARRWIKPATIRKAAAISSISQLDASRFIVTGRTHEQQGFIALHTPLMWEVEKVDCPEVRAYLAGASRPELGVGVCVGTSGHGVRLEAGQVSASVVPGEPDLSAVALDAAGRAWAASRGKIWVQFPENPEDWRCAWSDSSFEVPIVSVFADIGMVIAMTADGGILEGRLEMS